MKMPSVPGFHPRNATLNRYVDRTLELGSAKRVRVHLIGCLRCREVVDQIRELGIRVRAEGTPVASRNSGLLRRRESSSPREF
jgi:anti-sigma factor ChrR (cupin superfamily)